MKMHGRSLAVFLFTASLALLACTEVAAQTAPAYPNKPVKIVITLAAGGSNDIIARLFAQKFSEQLKQPLPGTASTTSAATADRRPAPLSRSPGT